MCKTPLWLHGDSEGVPCLINELSGSTCQTSLAFNETEEKPKIVIY